MAEIRVTVTAEVINEIGKSEVTFAATEVVVGAGNPSHFAQGLDKATEYARETVCRAMIANFGNTEEAGHFIRRGSYAGVKDRW